MTFLGTYAIYLPMHYLGILGMPRRYYAYGNTDFIPGSAHAVNEAITIAAIVVATAQVIFLINVVYSLIKGKTADSNPWRATTLEWQTPQTPPVHGNWGPKLPVVYRWAYDYSVPGEAKDFIPQNEPPKGPLVARRNRERRAMLTAMVIAMLTAITVWWLLVQRLKDKPWTKQGVVPTSPESEATSSAPKIGLWLFLAVVSSLFGIFASAYFMRMRHVHGGLEEWAPLAEPSVLWINTVDPRARERRDADRAQPRGSRRLRRRPHVLHGRGTADAAVRRRAGARLGAGDGHGQLRTRAAPRTRSSYC